jgi:hypothetical protein
MSTVLHIPISRATLDEKRALLASHGFYFLGDTGKGVLKGIEFDYTYNGTHLVLTITKKSILIPMSLVKSKLAEWTGVIPQDKS